MTRHTDLYFNDILHAAAKIQRYTRGMAFAEFKRDDKTVDAVIRNLHVIGEAARSVPIHVQNKNPQVPWRDIIAMRNILIHEYFGVDAAIIWKTVREDLPVLKKAIAAIRTEK